ncbi:MAG: F0F1 ATP synthase subunit delta [Chthoniobacterales bacterium]
MKISREARKLARELFRLALVDGRLDHKRVSEIIDAVANEKPRNYFSVLKELHRLIRLEVEKRHAVIETPIALDAAGTQAIEKSLHAKFGSDITTEFKVSPSLIAGLRVRLGSDVWDGSVLSRLNNLKEQL